MKQLKTRLNLQKAFIASEKMSEKERAAAIALTKAREQDAAAAERQGSVLRMPLNAPEGRKRATEAGCRYQKAQD